MPVPPDQLCQRPHSSAQEGCPYASRQGSQTTALKSYTVHFESLISDNIWRKIIGLAKEVCARLSPSSIKSAWYIGTQNDLSQPLLRSWRPGSYVSEFATPAGTVYVTADPVVMRAIFAHPRVSRSTRPVTDSRRRCRRHPAAGQGASQNDPDR